MASQREPFAVPALLTAVVVLASFARVLAGRTLVGGDMMACFEPFAVALADGLGRGDLLRSPLLFHGMPLLGNPVVAAGSPPQWLVALVDPAWAVSLLSVLHLAWGAAGMTILLRVGGRSPAASVAGGIVLGLSGVAVSSLVQPTLLRPLAWATWVLALALLAGRPGGRAAHAVALAASTSMLLVSAEPFVIVPCAAALLVLLARRPLREQARAIAGLGAGLAASLVVVVPIAWTVRASLRSAGFVREGAMQWSLHPAQALGFLIPRPFGEPGRVGLEGFAAVQLVPGRSAEYFSSSYLGALAIGLAAAGAITGGRRAWPLAGALGALVVLALGSHGPAGLLEIDALRYPVKWLVPALVPFAALVALGVEAAAGAGASRTRTLVALGLSAAAAAAVASAAGPLAEWIVSLGGDVPSGLRAHLTDAARVRLPALAAWSAGGALAAVIVVLAARRARVRVAPVIAGLLAADLAVAALRGTTTARRDERVPEVVRVLLAESVRQRAWLDVDSAVALELPRIETLEDLMRHRRATFMFYTGAAYGIDVAFPVEVESLCTLRLFQLAQAVRASGPRERLMLLGAAGVTHVVTADERLLALGSPAGGSDVGLSVLRNPLALPRVRLVPDVRVHSGEADVLALLRDAPPAFFARTTLVSGPDWNAAHPGEAPPSGSAAWRGSARLLDESPSEIVVGTSGDGGCLVVSDAWLPGFRASVDGEEAPLLPADHAFLGVIVPPGDHEVRFTYSPWRG